MGACVYGGAFNFLDIDNFIEVVKAQNWRAKKDVQLLIQDREDSCFTMYKLTDDQLNLNYSCRINNSRSDYF